MKEPTLFSDGIHFLLVVASLVIIIAGIHVANTAIAPILISVFLSVLGTPTVLWLKRHHVPISIAVLIVIIVLLVVIGVFAVIVGSSVDSFITAVPVYQERLYQQIDVVLKNLNGKGIVINDDVFTGFIDTKSISTLFIGFLGGVGSVVSNMVVILLTVSFILLEASSFPNKIRVAVGNPRAVFPAFTMFISEMQQYMIWQTILGLLTGIAVGCWLLVMGVDFAIILGILAFLFNYVPNVGSAIALVPTVTITFIQYGLTKAVVIAIGYLILAFIVGSIIQPRLIGKKFGLSTLVVFISLIFWGSLLGIIGMVLCVPLTMALKYMLESYSSTRWIGVLLERDVDTSEHK